MRPLPPSCIRSRAGTQPDEIGGKRGRKVTTKRTHAFHAAFVGGVRNALALVARVGRPVTTATTPATARWREQLIERALQNAAVAPSYVVQLPLVALLLPPPVDPKKREGGRLPCVTPPPPLVNLGVVALVCRRRCRAYREERLVQRSLPSAVPFMPP